MRLLLVPAAVVFSASTIFAQSVPSRVQDKVPDAYHCEETKSGLTDVVRKFTITRDGEDYQVAFLDTLKPGTLRGFLGPLGIDDRIIDHYKSWTVEPIRVPTASCEARTFGSLYAEELKCDAAGIEIKIKATYRDSNGRDKTDSYTINDAKIDLKTKMRNGLQGTICLEPNNGIKKALQFDFNVAFAGTNGSTATVKSTSAFHPDCGESSPTDGEGGGFRSKGHCSLKVFETDGSGDADYSTTVAKLIELRAKK